jgi:purine nucleosidase
MKVILDTDIGTDVDDAICLAYLLAQPNCELIGITTVMGEAVKRAQMASVLCKAAGKHVPIYPGVEQPLLIRSRQPKAPQAEALRGWEHETNFPENEVIEFLRRTIRANPGEVTLLCIGPMTNIALLFAVDPIAASLLKGLVMMVGVFTNQLANVGPLEANAIGDPHAIAKIYRTPVAAHRSVGLDVTCQVTMNADEVRKRFQIPLLRPVLDFAEVWFRESPVVTFHDPLAATTLFDDKICTFHRGSADIELSAGRMMGKTYWTADAGGTHQVALQVSPERFFAHYFSVLEQF